MEISYFLIRFLITLSILFFDFTFSLDTISPTKSLTNVTTLVSSGQIFELGFFTPGKSGKYYIGIWYKATPKDYVWVANRNNPLNDTFGEFKIGDNGKLILFDSAKSVVWSSNSSSLAKNPVALLLDTGNLVLKESESASNETFLWQSFDIPSDNLLQSMKIGWDFKSGLERHLTSWKGDEDPSEGNYTYRINITGLPQLVLVVGSTKLIRFGPWNGVEMRGFTIGTNTVYERTFLFNKNEASYSFKPIDNSVTTRVKITSASQIKRFRLDSGSNKWTQMTSSPNDECDNYGICGANSICRAQTVPICHCLDGFTPQSPQDWNILKWADGCVRKTKLDCSGGDGFEPLDRAKLPDLLHFWLNESMSLDECKAECVKNCSCVAYANSDVRDGGSGCLIWFGELIDIRELRGNETEQIMYVKLSASDIKSSDDDKSKKRRQKMKLAIFISCGVFIFLLLLGCMTWKLRKRFKDESEDIRGEEDLRDHGEDSRVGSEDNIELPLFDLATIKTATNNFSEANMIGEGGFGRVYMGHIPSGQEIAVKRLSKNSGQGLKEFKNEVELIAKLQHKNLVALLGCCIQKRERMLIYEFMPNKSLDHYIFGKRGTSLSSWKKNSDIIMGIARGLLYLHQDSKIPIIHRDLKAANVLLDNNMNPKISDFGLARIFGDDNEENKTMKIIGTYGYIPPEYADEGVFSVKFDVFSFGVLLLEIVSGKRNRRFSHRSQIHNLLGHMWLLWNKGEALELMDACFEGSGFESQVLRYIHIGLLCVQYNPMDRPTMNNVVLMLSNEVMALSHPNMPGFFLETSSNINIIEESSTSRIGELHSVNKMTFTLEGR